MEERLVSDRILLNVEDASAHEGVEELQMIVNELHFEVRRQQHQAKETALVKRYIMKAGEKARKNLKARIYLIDITMIPAIPKPMSVSLCLKN